MADGPHDVLARVREAGKRRILFLPHAVRQMAHPDRMISPKEVLAVIDHGDVIEDYPDDPRGPSCLLLGRGEGDRPIHIVCAPKVDYLAVVTAYLPDPAQWSGDFRERS